MSNYNRAREGIGVEGGVAGVNKKNPHSQEIYCLLGVK